MDSCIYFDRRNKSDQRDNDGGDDDDDFVFVDGEDGENGDDDGDPDAFALSRCRRPSCPTSCNSSLWLLAFGCCTKPIIFFQNVQHLFGCRKENNNNYK